MSLKSLMFMLSRATCILAVCLLLLSTGCNVPSTATPLGHWYVSPDGSDDNDCLTPQAPCKTIAAALDKAVEDGTIHLAGGTYLETLSVTKSITITGEGATTDAIIDGDGKTGTVVNINCFACFINVVLSDLTIQNGNASSGGGLSIVNADVQLASVLIRNNKATLAGGGINIQAGSSLTMTNSSIEDNEVTGISEYSGGAGIFNSGTLFMTNVSITDNLAFDWGGGLNNQGTAALIAVTFSGNETEGNGGGAGIYNTGSLTLTSCTFQDGRVYGSSGSGGALLNLGTVEINGLDAYSNQAGGDGGAIANLEGGVLTFHDGTLSGNHASMGGGFTNNGGEATLVGVLIENNQAVLYGGGIMNMNDGTLNLTNVTLSQNEAGLTGGGIGNGNPSGNLLAMNVTIAYNTSLAGQDGGGIYFLGGVTTFINVLLAGNSAGNCDGDAIEGGMNLSSDATCQFTGYGNLYAIDPKIGPLADNGGSTLTYALLPGSPAIDTGTEWLAPETDQRGVDRPVDGDLDGLLRVDIGAVEFAYEMMSAPVDVPAVTPTLWPLHFTPIERSSCRTGPGMVYPGLIILPAGEPVEVEGRSEDFGWIELNLDGTIRCWVESILGSLDGDPAWLGISEIPPTPTFFFPTPTFTSVPAVSCQLYTTQDSCTEHGCDWKDGGCHNP